MAGRFDYPAYDFTRCAACRHQYGECLPPDDGAECPRFEAEEERD